MIYLEVPEAGGATVFPLLGLTVFAEKGDSILWWNLLENGEPDEIALHAGCSVLSGQKWVANTWFRERGQMFMRPCGLDPEE